MWVRRFILEEEILAEKNKGFPVLNDKRSKGPGTRIYFFEIFSKFKYFGNILNMLHEE